MKLKSWNVIAVVFTAVLGISLTLSSPAFAYDEKNPMVLKAAIDNPPGDMKAVTIKRMGDLIEERTNGRVKFQYFYSGALIKKPQFVEAVAKGIADISTGPVSFITGKIPELSIFEVYGAFKLDKHLEVQEAVEPILIELFETKGIRPLMNQYTGSTIFPHKTKFVKAPADWKGQKMRLAGRWQSTLGKQWGASPVFMPPADLYVALQRGVIDGYMLIWDIVYGLKLYEVAPYIVDSGFSNNIEVVTMNLKKWQELTPADQKIFNEVRNEVKPWNMTETLKHYEKLKKDILSKGGKIHEMTPEEKSLYLKDAYALYPQVKEVSGTLGSKFIEILEPYRDK
jgi:TRAP-type C4-dicarboxylate transport system substrate-binding protein